MTNTLQTPKIQKVLAASIIFAFLSVALFQTIGITRLFSAEIAIFILSGSALLALFAFNHHAIKNNQVLVICIFLALYLFTAFTSRYPSVSLAMAFHLLASALLFVGLINADENSNKNTFSNQNNYPVTDAAKIAFVCCTSFQALCMLFFYLFEPVRTTGIMDDYSQASMILLLGYGMSYPILKNKIYFSAFSLVYFVAFFTTFSRTANALLIVLFIALFILERKSGDFRNVIKLALLAFFALAFVYWYPQVVGETTVSRGGLSQLSTLNSRTIYWQAAWEAIQQRPFIGHGLGLFSFTGINEAQPFNIILYIHNDYLQIWHDLGVFWLILFVGTLSYLLIRYSPLKIDKGSRTLLSIDTSNSRQFLGWAMLLAIAMYMGINFLINNLEFQVAIAILVADLLKKRAS